MAKNNNLTDFLTGVADAIRRKRGTTGKINPQNFEEEISGIPTRKPEEEKTVTPFFPGGENQLILPTDGKVMSKVTIEKPSALIRSNIRNNVMISGVVGTLQERKPEQSKSVTITENGSTQIFPDSGKTLSRVIITTNVSGGGGGGGGGGYTVYFDSEWTSFYGSGRMGTVKFLYADGTDYTSVDNNLNSASFSNVASVTFTEMEGESWMITYEVNGSQDSLWLSSKSTETLTLTGDTTFLSFSK